MSLIPLDYSVTLEALSQEIITYETRGEYNESGLWEKTKYPNRNIFGILLEASAEQIAIMTDGDVSSGGIVIHTHETLYYQDPKIKEQVRQTYIKYQGYIFRVISRGLQNTNANYNTYVATRYQDYGSDT